jgi:hypothetical protein
MSLKIENIKLDKDIYTFWVDKEIKWSFTLISDGKDYKINSINIKHWVIFYLFLDKKSEYIKNITISKNIQILWNEPQKFEFIIPINYPNEDDNISKSPMFDNWIEFKNFIKINIDVKFNPFDIEEEFYPNIILDKRLTSENFSYLEKTDFINKSFYKSLIKKHISFFIYDKVKKLNNDKSVLLIFITIFILLLLTWYISHYYRKYDNVLSLGLLSLFIWTIFFSLIVQISIKKIKIVM